MSFPARVGSAGTLAKVQAIMDRRGIVPTADQLDDVPDPDEPGHPEYHRRSRVQFALDRWTAATPRRYRHATATNPRVHKWLEDATRWMASTDDSDDEPPLRSLLLTGPTGTGKTHEAYGALRALAESAPRRRYHLIATTTADMYGALRPGGQTGAAEHYLGQLSTVPLLLLDDLGSAKASEWTEETTYRLINERYNTCLPTIFTSNLPPRAVDERGQPTGGPDLAGMLGDRIVSRLAEMTTVIGLTGRDRRRTGTAA